MRDAAIYATSAIVIAITAGLFWRFGLWRKLVNWSPWPAKLEVTEQAMIWELTADRLPNKRTYRTAVEVAITPWTNVPIADFYLETTKGSSCRKVPQEPVVGDDGCVELGRGFRLRADSPIGPVFLNFQLTVEGSEVPTQAYIVLEAGIRRGGRAIKKPVILNLRPESTQAQHHI